MSKSETYPMTDSVLLLLLLSSSLYKKKTDLRVVSCLNGDWPTHEG